MTLSAAESCTAGLIADSIARVPGASGVFWGSFVTYTPDSKSVMLAIDGELIKEHGSVSEAVALAMAKAALDKSGSTYSLSVTGLAGPDGDGSEVPVGTIWVGIAGGKGNIFARRFLFKGLRNDVREAAAGAALEELLAWIG